MQRNSALLLITFAVHHIGDTKQLCEYSNLSRPTCSEAIEDLQRLGYVAIIAPPDARFVNNKNTFAITSIGSEYLCKIANQANDYTEQIFGNAATGSEFTAKRFVAPTKEENTVSIEIQQRNQFITKASSIAELLMPFGFSSTDIQSLSKLSHVNLEYAQKFLRSGMAPAQAVALMEKNWPAPNFDLFEQ